MKKPRTEAWGYHNRVKPLLKELGCRYNRIENTAGVGYPDIDLTYKGINMKLEMKLARSGTGRMSIHEYQYEWHKRELNAGGNAYVLAYWPVNDELHLFKLEENKCRIIDYETILIEKAEDLIAHLIS